MEASVHNLNSEDVEKEQRFSFQVCCITSFIIFFSLATHCAGECWNKCWSELYIGPPDFPWPCRGGPEPQRRPEQLGSRPRKRASTLNRCGTHWAQWSGEWRAALAPRDYGHGGRRGGPVLGAVHPASQYSRLGGRRRGRRGNVDSADPAAGIDAHWWVG